MAKNPPTGEAQSPPPADASISAAMHPTPPKVPMAQPVPPTVGRIVHFVTPDQPPLAAIVVGGADGADKVVLTVFTPQHGRFTKVCGWADANDGTGWAWPPKV